MANYHLFLGSAPEINSDEEAVAAALNVGLGQGVDGYSGDPIIGAWYGNLGNGTARIFRSPGEWGAYFDYNHTSNTLTVGTTTTITGSIDSNTNKLAFNLLPGSIGFDYLTEEAVNQILAKQRRPHYGYVSGFWDPNTDLTPISGRWVASDTKFGDPTINIISGNYYVFGTDGLEGVFTSETLPSHFDAASLRSWDPTVDVVPVGEAVLATANATLNVAISIVTGNTYTFAGGILTSTFTDLTPDMTRWDPLNESVPTDDAVVATSSAIIEATDGFTRDEVYEFESASITQISDGVQLSDLFELSGDTDNSGTIDEGEMPGGLYSYQILASGSGWAAASTVPLDDVRQLIQNAVDEYRIWYIDYNPNKGPRPGEPNEGLALTSPTKNRTVKFVVPATGRTYSYSTISGGGVNSWFPG